MNRLRLILWLSRLAPLILFGSPMLAQGQTLAVNNETQTHATLASTAVTVSGKGELKITGAGDPITGCTINLTSPDAWFFMTAIQPSTVVSTFLSRVRVNGAAAVVDSNCRVVQYGALGAVVIPQAPGFAPMTVFTGGGFTGDSMALTQYTAYGATELGVFNDNISSFKLKRGYTATIAQNPAGTVISKNYVAADGDLEISVLPGNLNNQVSFVRIFPWRWVGKKGSCDVDPVALNADWFYNWNISSNSTRDWEYVAIKQQPNWPSLAQDWKWRGVNHLSGYNEPDNPVEDAYTNLDPDGSVSNAVARMPELLGTGLRVGAPAVTDGGYSWIVDFVNQANAAGYRIDYVPVHYYRSYTSASDPAGATTQLYNFLKSIYDATGKPVWVTEFNNGANWTSGPDPSTDQNKATIEAMIDMMDATPWIERYAVYSNVEWFRDTHYAEGGYTPMGAMYRDHVAPMAYQQDLPDGFYPYATYSFNGDAQDTTGYANDAMQIGGPTFTNGPAPVLNLNGTSAYLRLPPKLGDCTDFTFGGWVKWDGGADWQRIFDFGEDAGNYMFLTPKGGGNLRFAIKDGGAEQQLNGPALTVGQWTHVAVTISGNTGKLFVNGVLVNTNPGMTINPVDLGTKMNYIGKSQFNDPTFKGQLDELRFYDFSITDAQVAAMSGVTAPRFSANPVLALTTPTLQPITGSLAGTTTGGTGTITFSKVSGPPWLSVSPNGALIGVPGMADTGVNTFVVKVADASEVATPFHTTSLQITVADPPGLIARYAFDGSVNASAGVTHGGTTGTPAYTTGVNGSAIDLDGVDDHVTLPAGIANHPVITLAAWFWRDSTAGWQRLFDFGTGTDDYLFLSPRSGSAQIHFGIKNGGAEQSLTTPSLPTGQWVHVAVTLGGNVGKLYVNGSLADTDTITIKPTDFLHQINYLGKSQWPDPLFDGRIDEFLIYNKVLDATQIASLATAGNRAPIFTADPIGSLPVAPVDQPYSEYLTGLATDPNAGSALTFSKVSGPAWLTVSPNGRVSGVPSGADAGTNRFIVRVTDSTLLSDDATLNLAVGNPSGLIAHHPFDSSVADNIGGAAGITTTGSPAYTAGLFDHALRFDGADDVVQLRSGLLNGVTDMTFAARVRWNGGGDWQRIFDFGNGTNQFLFLTPKTGSVSRFAMKNGAAEANLDGPALPVGEWAHVAITLVGNTGTFYLNGSPVSTGNVTLDPSAIAPTINYLADSQYAADPLFNGVIDDLRIYNTGLTAQAVGALAVSTAALVVPEPAFDAWVASIAFPGGQSGPAADPDQDGLSNGIEFLTGGDPLVPGSNPIPAPKVMSASQLGLGAAAKNYLTLSARVRRDRTGVVLSPRAAATIEGLADPASAANVLQAGLPVQDGAFETITYYDKTAIEDSPQGKGFMRLSVTAE